jgi:hypothetical protein
VGAEILDMGDTFIVGMCHSSGDNGELSRRTKMMTTCDHRHCDWDLGGGKKMMASSLWINDDSLIIAGAVGV